MPASLIIRPIGAKVLSKPDKAIINPEQREDLLNIALAYERMAERAERRTALTE